MHCSKALLMTIHPTNKSQKTNISFKNKVTGTTWLGVPDAELARARALLPLLALASPSALGRLGPEEAAEPSARPLWRRQGAAQDVLPLESRAPAVMCLSWPCDRSPTIPHPQNSTTNK